MLNHSIKTVTIIGGTGSFGYAMVQELLKQNLHEIRVYSRDEEKQYAMRNEFEADNLTYIIGNIRDYSSVYEATVNTDLLIHAAALKIIPTCEKHPVESIKTNLLGTMNVKKAATVNKVPRNIFLSTDKAVQPVNVYGACKMLAEKLWIKNSTEHSRFTAVRYGNVLGSRGSVIPFFKQKVENNQAIPITHPRMTRFFITLDQAVKFVLNVAEQMKGEETYVPKLGSCRILDLAYILAGPRYRIEYVGIRPGEKIHETLISTEEFRRTTEKPSYYVIRPHTKQSNIKIRRDYRSDNTNKLSMQELKEMLKPWL